jgi:hypothetical protein
VLKGSFDSLKAINIMKLVKICAEEKKEPTTLKEENRPIRLEEILMCVF